MADTLGQKELRGINIDRVAKGFADEDFVFKKFLTVSPTSNRELRYWRKTAGVIGTTNTTGITKNQSVGAAFGALPPIAEQSMTRITAFVKHFAIESPWISDADIRDSDPDIWAANVRDLTRSIANQVDFRILDVLSGSTLLSGSAAGTGWTDSSNGNPFLDLLSGSMEIRKQGYSIGQTTAWLHPDDFKSPAVQLFETTMLTLAILVITKS